MAGSIYFFVGIFLLGITNGQTTHSQVPGCSETCSACKNITEENYRGTWYLKAEFDQRCPGMCLYQKEDKEMCFCDPGPIGYKSCNTSWTEGDDQKWKSFKLKYNKTYSDSDTEMHRRGIWFNNFKLIESHNKKYDAGLFTFYLGENTFMDLTNDEFSSKYTGYRKPEGNNTVAPIADLSQYVLADLPSSINWTEAGWVTDVKNQGQCGCCWAFSAAGAIEGQHFNKTFNLISLSAQQLVDCDKTSFGCFGGLPYKAFQYVINNNGIDSESGYPGGYKAKDGTCKYQLPEAAAISNYQLIQSGSEEDLQKAVAKVGPISVAIDATGSEFQNYKGGIYNPSVCSSTNLNHAVLAVGYGTNSAGIDYWLVKNSWGTGWGLDGYIKMIRNDKNHCGIATDASYPQN